jgi:RecB family exonuclease
MLQHVGQLIALSPTLSAYLEEPQEQPQEAAALSASQINKFLDCQAAWYYSRRLRLPDPATGALALGKAFHKATESALWTKAFREPQPAPAERAEEFQVLLNTELETTELREDEDTGSLFAQGLQMLSIWHTDALPTLEPAMRDGRPATEVAITGTIEGVRVRALIDLFEKSGTIVDTKTAKAKPAGISGSHKLQLGIYGCLTGATEGRIVTTTKAKTPGVVSHTTSLEGPSDHARRLIPIVAEAMESGLYLPNRSSNYCSRKYCSFWRQCQTDYGGEVAA